MTAHDEGLLLQPTLAAMTKAADFFTESGGKIELIAVADNANNCTETILERFRETAVLPCTILKTSFGEPGPARNEGVKAASYDWIAIHDGDEMVCEDWFYLALIAIEKRPLAIAHSHWSLVFGRENLIWGHPKEDSLVYDDFDLEISNPWSVQCVAAKEVFKRVPYRAYRNDPLFELEDWYWNAETAVAGYEHLRIRDTVHAVRRKHMSRDLKAKLNKKILAPIPPRKSLSASEVVKDARHSLKKKKG